MTLLCLIDWSIIENTSFGCHSWKIPKVCWDKHSWRRCGHESGLKRFPWKIQRQNVVVCHQNTGLLAFMVLTSITSWSESNVMQCRGFETKPNCFRCSWCEFEHLHLESVSVVWILIDYDELRSFWVSLDKYPIDDFSASEQRILSHTCRNWPHHKQNKTPTRCWVKNNLNLGISEMLNNGSLPVSLVKSFKLNCHI